MSDCQGLVTVTVTLTLNQVKRYPITHHSLTSIDTPLTKDYISRRSEEHSVDVKWTLTPVLLREVKKRQKREKNKKESHKQWYFTHVPRPPTQPDRSHIWKFR